MADLLADFDLGTGLDDGSSWANAFKTPGTMDSGMSAGDRCFIQGDHSQSSALTLDSPGTVTNPCIYIGVKQGTTNDPVEETDVVDDQDDANMPSITTTGVNDIKPRDFARWWGVKFVTGNNFVDVNTTTGWIMEQCHIVLGAANSDNVNIRGGLDWIDVKLELSHAGNVVLCSGLLTIKNVTLAGVAPTTQLYEPQGYGRIIDYGSDLSSVGSNPVVDFDDGTVELIGCRLGTSFVLINSRSGDVWNTAVRAYLCDSGTGITNPITTFNEAYQMGDNADETTVVMSDGSSDGVTAHSIKMSPVDNSVTEGVLSLLSPKIEGWVGSASVAVSSTFTVNIHNTVADFDDDEVWLELFIPTKDSAQMGRFTTLPTPLATVAAITDDTTTWNGSADFSQKLSITATPDHEGPVFGWVHYAKRGVSVPDLYVNTKIVVAAA